MFFLRLHLTQPPPPHSNIRGGVCSVPELKVALTHFVAGHRAEDMSCNRGDSGCYGNQIKHWNPPVSVLALVSRVSDRKLSPGATSSSPHTHRLDLTSHITPPHLHVKPNTNTHTRKTRSVPPTAIKTNPHPRHVPFP